MFDYIAELRKVFSYYKIDGENVRVGPCPKCSAHHALSVNIYGKAVPPGAYHCWSCDDFHGTWNDLAKKMHMPLVKKSDLLTEKAHTLLYRNTTEKIVKKPAPFEIQEWEGTWRGISEELLIALGAKLWLDSNLKNNKAIFITKRLKLPVIQNDEEIGYVAAIISKKDRKNRQDKYKNSPGRWVRNALWPFDFIGMIKALCLVEGPYDALKLIYNGIPALCFFGVRNWNKRKISLLHSLGVQIVIPLTDNDAAGRRCKKRIIKDCRKEFDVREFPYVSQDPGKITHKEIGLLQYFIKKLESKIHT